MGNIKLIFCEQDATTELQAYVNNENKLYLEINMHDGSYDPNYICLDLKTSIALLNHLEKQISILNPPNPIKLKFK